jgi:hypothetical protein
MPEARQRVAAFCPLCVSRCGCEAVVEDGRLVAIEPDLSHPTGKALCAKGRASPELVESAIRSLPGDNRTFSTTRSTLQQCNTRQLTQFALLCSSFTTSGFTQPRKSRAGRPL